MRLRNEFFRNGTLAARVTTAAGWLDLNQRRLVPPPSALLAALRSLDKSEDFVTMPTSANTLPAT